MRVSCRTGIGLARVYRPLLSQASPMQTTTLSPTPRTTVGRGLPQSGALVPTPEAEVDHDVAAELERTQPDLDEPALDHVLSRRRVLLPVERFHPFVLGETKRLSFDLKTAGGGGLHAVGLGTGGAGGGERCRRGGGAADQ